ncbi:MAG: hypothetical protein HY721_25480 [Planctomycetes bacterium]|nr:hypothetical protein [Planctomycetota bacterium]
MTRRRTLALATGGLLAAALFAYVLRPRQAGDDGTAPLDPTAIPFPSLSGPALTRLEEAKARHRAALEGWRSGRRAEGDAEARRALALYEAAGALVPPLSGLHYEVIVSLAAEGRTGEALGAARRWLERFPADRLHRETLAKLHYQAGRHAEAAAELEALLAGAPGDAAILRRLVEARVLQGARDEALSALDLYLAAEGLDPPTAAGAPARAGEAGALRLAARALQRFGEDGRALPLLTRLREVEPSDGEARLSRGAALRALGRSAEARAELEPLRGDPVLGADATLELALATAKDGGHGEAARLLCDLLERDPWRAAGYHQLAASLRRLGRDAWAESMERAAASLRPSERERTRGSERRSAGLAAEAAASRALSLALAGRFREADGALREAAFATSPALVLERSKLYLEWLRGVEAVEILEPLAAGPGAPPEASRLLEAARSLVATGRVPGAQPPGASPDLLRRIAASRWPESAPLLADLARAEGEGDRGGGGDQDGSLRADRSRAIAAARLARAADPGLADAHRVLARLLEQPEEVFLRLEAWRVLATLEPGDVEARRGIEACRAAIGEMR